VSVTLKYRDKIGRNTLKIIPRLISLVFSVCMDHNIIDLLQREHHEISAETGIRPMTCYILNIHCESKKLCHFYFYCNFGKCWSIFKILSMSESERNGS